MYMYVVPEMYHVQAVANLSIFNAIAYCRPKKCLFLVSCFKK